jgi:hypothetical protein
MFYSADPWSSSSITIKKRFWCDDFSSAVCIGGIVEHFVPRRTVERVVAVVAEQFRALPDPAARLDGHDPAEPRVVKVDKLGVGGEGVVDLGSVL